MKGVRTFPVLLATLMCNPVQGADGMTAVNRFRPPVESGSFAAPLRHDVVQRLPIVSDFTRPAYNNAPARTALSGGAAGVGAEGPVVRYGPIIFYLLLFAAFAAAVYVATRNREWLRLSGPRPVDSAVVAAETSQLLASLADTWSECLSRKEPVSLLIVSACESPRPAEALRPLLDICRQEIKRWGHNGYGRYFGEDRVAVVAPNCGIKEALRLADQIREAVTSGRSSGGESAGALRSVCIGVACGVPAPSVVDSEALVRLAQAAARMAHAVDGPGSVRSGLVFVS